MRVPARRLLDCNRSLPCDILHFASKMPLARAEMSFDLSQVSESRQRVSPRVSWTALFLKGYGIVSNEVEVLRQSYLRWPAPHVLQHGQTVAMLAIQREHEGRPRLCWGRIIDPAARTLREIQSQLDSFTSKPVTEAFRKQIRLSRLPWPLRRLAWWVALNGTGRMRERQVGTFSMSSLARQGVNNRDHPTICTSSLTYGPLDSTGQSLVTLVYDHRLMDGMQAAQALQRLETLLQDQLAAELQPISVHRAA